MKFLILGAGPAGLAFANYLKQNGCNDFLVLEKEHTAGGLCRSTEVDGAPLDIGGGHFLDVRRPNVNKFLFGFMPEDEWNLFVRDSKIELGKNVISHPLEANIWQLDIESQIAYLKSIAIAGYNLGASTPSDFVEWIYWKFGNRIAEDYMLPYNHKMFCDELNNLGTYWLEKLPNVSFDETLRSCIEKKAYGTQPGHAEFYYPKKHGYGEIWLRMSDAIRGNILYGKNVNGIDFDERIVSTNDGYEYRGDIIVTTIPWNELKCNKGMPSDIEKFVGELKHSSILVEYYGQKVETSAQWIYIPDPNIAHHRILVRHNFCNGSKGYWTETNAQRKHLVAEPGSFSYHNKYAYPLNTISKEMAAKQLLEWGSRHNIYGLGRWGEHQHYNSDVTVERAVSLANRLLKSK